MNNTEKMLYRSTMDDTGRGHGIHDLYRADRRVQRCGKMDLFPETGENGLYRTRLDGSEIFRLLSIEKKKLYRKNTKKKQMYAQGIPADMIIGPYCL